MCVGYQHHQIKVVTLYQELAESEPKAYHKHQRERGHTEKHILINNRIKDNETSSQLFPKQVANSVTCAELNELDTQKS